MHLAHTQQLRQRPQTHKHTSRRFAHGLGRARPKSRRADRFSYRRGLFVFVFRTEAPRATRHTAKFRSRPRPSATEAAQVVRARLEDNATTEIGAASRGRFSGAVAGGW